MAVYIFANKDRHIFASPPTSFAVWLLNKLIIRENVILRIVETEAYGAIDDQASHAYRGKRLFNATMFLPAGHLYVYKIYGIHYCANVVCGGTDSPAAVLLRAAEIIEGKEVVQSRRDKQGDSSLVSGPGNLALALGITTYVDGEDLLYNSSVKIATDGIEPPENYLQAKRVGLGKNSGSAALYNWRYGVPNSLALSKKFL